MPFGGGPVSSRPKWRLSVCSARLPRLGGKAGENGDEADASIWALDEAIERATALEAPYELALSLANRVALAALAAVTAGADTESTTVTGRRPSSKVSASPRPSSHGRPRMAEGRCSHAGRRRLRRPAPPAGDPPGWAAMAGGEGGGPRCQRRRARRTTSAICGLSGGGSMRGSTACSSTVKSSPSSRPRSSAST